MNIFVANKSFSTEIYVAIQKALFRMRVLPFVDSLQTLNSVTVPLFIHGNVHILDVCTISIGPE